MSLVGFIVDSITQIEGNINETVLELFSSIIIEISPPLIHSYKKYPSCMDVGLK